MLTNLKNMLKRKVYRSAVTGRFVDADFARDHPDTTIAQTVWILENTA